MSTAASRLPFEAPDLLLIGVADCGKSVGTEDQAALMGFFRAIKLEDRGDRAIRILRGAIEGGESEAFYAAVMDILLPKWKAFPGALSVRIAFAETRDDDAPEIPLILAVDYPDLAAVEAALASPARAAAKSVTDEVLPRFFDGRIHHHVTEAHEFAADA